MVAQQHYLLHVPSMIVNELVNRRNPPSKNSARGCGCAVDGGVVVVAVVVWARDRALVFWTVLDRRLVEPVATTVAEYVEVVPCYRADTCRNVSTMFPNRVCKTRENNLKSPPRRGHKDWYRPDKERRRSDVHQTRYSLFLIPYSRLIGASDRLIG